MAPILEFLLCTVVSCGNVRFTTPPEPQPFSTPRVAECTHAWKPNLPQCKFK